MDVCSALTAVKRRQFMRVSYTGQLIIKKEKRGNKMSKKGGYPGGMIPGSMNNLMKQAQRMQRQMEENQKQLETQEFTADAGGGAVSVTVTGKKEVTKVVISKDAADPEDVDMLQDLIMAAVNEAMRKADEATADAMGKMTGGMGLGGM